MSEIKEKWKAEYDYLDVGGWAVFEDTEEQAVECISADLTKSRAPAHNTV